MISSAQIHPRLTLFFRRDYFGRSDSSLSCSFSLQGLLLPLRCIPSLLFSPQGLLRPPGFISILLFFTTGIIATARIHPQLAFWCRRDDFFCSDASPACSFPPQGLLRPPGFIPILLFFSAGITSSARIHPQLALFLRRDYFYRPDSALSCSSVPQGLFLPPRFISSLLFSSAGMISAAQIHLYLALFHHRDYF